MKWPNNYHTEFQQGTIEWLNYRMGKITASRIIDIMPSTRGYRSSRDNYMAELACEILTGIRQENYTSPEMQRGSEMEQFARAEYEIRNGEMAEEIGFINHPEIEDAGCSPDGIMQYGNVIIKGLEIKCPKTATHLNTVFTGKIKRDYELQIQFSMMCAQINTWEFVSFDDRLPEHIQYYQKTIFEYAKLQTEIKQEILKFQAELKVMLDKIKNYKG